MPQALRRSLAGALFLALSAMDLHAQAFPDLGRALFAGGFTATVWVNSFDRRLDYLAHGVFYPDTPIRANGYDARYGMTLAGSGSVSVGPDGFYIAAGLATNPNAAPAEGDISIDLLKSGNKVGSAEVPFRCGPSAQCPWEAHFSVKPSDFARAPLRAFTVKVYRHVQGSRCGGELTPDLNSEPCRSAVVARFNLPFGYRFTPTDFLDTNYLAQPNATTTALCAAILPLCSSTTPPPPADPCAAWLEASRHWLNTMPSPESTGDSSCAGLSAALTAWLAAAPQPPPSCVNP